MKVLIYINIIQITKVFVFGLKFILELIGETNESINIWRNDVAPKTSRI
jgi:hypothetical protein